MSSSSTTTTPSDNTTSWIVKFVPFTSTVESSFWVRYCQEKLDTIQLSEQPIDLIGTYGIGNASRLQLQETSLNVSSAENIPKDRIPIQGTLLGLNTLEAFQTLDKNELVQKYMQPFKLTSFLVLTFADLKNHKVLYWFAMPALMPTESIRAVQQDTLCETWTSEECKNLVTAVETLRSESASCPPYFIYNGESCFPLSDYPQVNNENDDNIIMFGFMDPTTTTTSSSEQHTPMGWPMRNLIAHLSIHLKLGGKNVVIISYRPKLLSPAQDDNDIVGTSMLLHVIVPTDYNSQKVVGWELNTRGKPGPRWVNLRPLLDPHHLAIQAADLNLKLIKWRMLPSLDILKLQSTKVLIIGAGTLGCSVARILLGWGVRHLQFVDNGKVSYSNPVRQYLFTLEDCCQDVPKAMAAANALKSIAADVKSQGHLLSIPMPGHLAESLETTVEQLDSMVQDCDVVFLLTDTRESRWLPTVMAAAHDKILLNAALGLDSWLVMRHGGGLGCYFCNDVVAPENSLKNRTLDQQCTVTRPGLSPIASAMAVELMVALLHHPLGQRAPAPAVRKKDFSPTDNSGAGALGVMPHQIRGSLVSYTMMTPTVPAFPYCTGCAPSVVQAYQADKTALVQAVCESTDGSYLEDLSGLTAFRAEAAEKIVDMEDWEDDE